MFATLAAHRWECVVGRCVVALPASSLRGSIPVPRTRLIGREADIAGARTFLLDNATPLLTLTGPGGVGKTRLALAIGHEVAEYFTDGAAFVDLSPLIDPILVTATVATGLGVTIAADGSLSEALVAFLRSQQCLLILDNCEQVLAAAADLVSVLLTSCPAVQVLATSRAPLHVRGEQVVSVPPLQLPETGAMQLDRIRQAPAVRLFAQRAREVDVQFVLDDQNAGAVAAICQQLDGLPLALELAATRSSTLSPAALQALLSQRLQVLGTGPRDAPARHQTIHDAIAWSYDLLAPADQVFFRSLAVFAGGWTLEAAAAVNDLSLPDTLTRLEALVDQSLVRRQAGTNAASPRFTMLETIRAFAQEQLRETPQYTPVRRAHADYFLALAESAEPFLRGPDQFSWFDRLEADYPNFREALRWYTDEADLAGALRLAGALGRFWEARGSATEGRLHFTQLLAKPERTLVAPGIVAKALNWAGTLAWVQGDLAHALQLHHVALAKYQEEGDDRGIAYSLTSIGLVHLLRGAVDAAAGPLHDARLSWEEQGDAWGLGMVSMELGILACLQGDFVGGEERFRDGLTQYRTAQDPEGTAFAQIFLGGTILERDTPNVDALALVLDGVAHLRAHHRRNPALASGLLTLGGKYYAQGQHEAALASFREFLAMSRDLGDRLGYAQGFEGVGQCLIARGRSEDGVRLLAAADQLRETLDIPPTPRQQMILDGLKDKLRQEFGDTHYGAVWAAGIAMPPDRLLLEILNLSEDHSPANPADRPAQKRSTGPGSRFTLTRREQEILGLLCQRLTDAEIAEALFISRFTASRHVANIYSKLGVGSRREAAALAARHGLV
jgi:predicted ATPase/DNA-binding CsgD family transcriptional regulator